MRRLHRRVKQLECIASENTFRDRNKQKIIAAAATDAEDDKQALQTSTHTHSQLQRGCTLPTTYRYRGITAIFYHYSGSTVDISPFNIDTSVLPFSQLPCHSLQPSQLWGARHFCPKIYAWKINKVPEFYMPFAQKITIPEFYIIFARKWPNFTWYLPKNIFPEIQEGM